ncbi:class I SAM-dependent rRNA methyltransferase [Helicovermis profundi]|uniref:Class I SAM-dependent rRNA methyltransferase n=1 Tax=Helicovermis profundi TaxID=3065157 RepID=A0AAU9E2Z3_9FIRM|nr:class I SAM-dependent rRNA methyltransferase [Clostridia bacterium S502]
MKVKNVKINKKFVDKYKKGYPLILKKALLEEVVLEEGNVIKLLDERNKFIALAYYGIQNKGIGWILSLNEKEIIDFKFFEKKILSAIKFRENYYNSSITNAFRVFNGEGDGIGGFTIDYFDGYYLINWYSKGAYKYRDYVINTLKKLTNMKGIYQKKRFDNSGKFIDEDGFVLGEKSDFPLIIKENNVNFAIYLNEGAMVGVFLDQKDVRNRIKRSYSRGKTVLNTFSYTGAFSVYASIGGASKTTSVDLANRSYAKTIEQFSINEIDYENEDIVVMDVFDYFNYAIRNNFKFDTVILDPPSYAKSKKRKFSAAKDYKDLIKDVIKITKKGGVIVASTNCAAFDMKKFKTFVDDAFKESKSNYKILEEYKLPRDFKTLKSFPEGNYLKVLFIEKNS